MGNTARKVNDKEAPAEMSVVKNVPEVKTPEVKIEAAVVTPPAPAPEEKKAPVLTLQERIQKVEDLSILVEKRSQLMNSLREISNFKLSSDAMSNRIQIRNAATQREFNTSNTEVISEIIDVVIRRIEAKVAEVDANITF